MEHIGSNVPTVMIRLTFGTRYRDYIRDYIGDFFMKRNCINVCLKAADSRA